MNAEHRFVPDLPDLIGTCEYGEHLGGHLGRARIAWDEQGVEVPGDVFRPDTLEDLLDRMAPDVVEQRLCG
ncbi:radical SAM-modified peptide, FtsH ternary system-associated [Streptomyces sp. NPDC093094]|uniref:radical SAM-modified peptide, FtsH ternary system-associated n=1 Tax=Streptomyces sp. NPDC093094 TaxID=3366026 RepID=UPI00380569BD